MAPSYGGRLIFIDETSVATNMTRRYGRAKIDDRCKDYSPHGHYKSMTFICGICNDGVVAPWCIDGAMNGESFKTYLKTQLIPVLRQGDIVIADNLSVHKVAGVREMIEAVGAKIRYLPPYSPDFNPIEQFFAKLKAFLRRIKPRTITALWRTIGRLIKYFFNNQEIRNYIINSGYQSSNNLNTSM